MVVTIIKPPMAQGDIIAFVHALFRIKAVDPSSIAPVSPFHELQVKHLGSLPRPGGYPYGLSRCARRMAGEQMLIRRRPAPQQIWDTIHPSEPHHPGLSVRKDPLLSRPLTHRSHRFGCVSGREKPIRRPARLTGKTSLAPDHAGTLGKQRLPGQ